MNSIHEFLFFHGWWWWRFLFWFWARVCHTHTSKYLKHPKRSEMNEWMKILSELREKNKRKKHSFNKRKIFSRKWKCIYVCDEINEKTKTLWHTQRTIFNECLLHFDKIFSRFFCFVLLLMWMNGHSLSLDDDDDDGHFHCVIDLNWCLHLFVHFFCFVLFFFSGW